MQPAQRPFKSVAIVPAAGASNRFGAGHNKLLAELMGKPVLLHTLLALQASDDVAEIIPVVHPLEMAAVGDLVEAHGISKAKKIAPGGKHRHESVISGLRIVGGGQDTIVLVHDGARPLLEPEIISRVLNGLQGHDGSVCAVAPKDTIKQVALDGTVRHTPDRATLVAVQTPQAFTLGTLLASYNKMGKGRMPTDDATVVELAGGRINVVQGSYRNIKITTPEDLALAETLLRHDTA